MIAIKEKLKTKKTSLAALALAGFAVTTSVTSDIVSAAAKDELGKGVDSTGQSGGVKLEDAITTITNVAFFLIGAISVIMIIWSGFRYITSNGDAGNVKSAKDTLMYSVVGLIVALLGYAIVRFVIDTFTN